MEGNPMHIYTDGTDTVIANDIEEADRVFEQYCGDNHSRSDPWRELPDDEHFDVMYEDPPGQYGDTVIPPEAFIEKASEDEPLPYPYQYIVTATVAQWAACNKPHFLCSTEY
jgi:hypothetical protein